MDIAANGFEAVQMAGHLLYDLIFRDSQMPEMDGFPASRKIGLLGGAQESRHRRSQPSGHPDDRLKCLDSGINQYLTKPAPMEALTGALERWSAAVSVPVLDVPAAALVS